MRNLDKLHAKQKRRRERLKEGALCECCGRDAYPFTTCERRRAYKRAWYLAHTTKSYRRPHGVHKPRGFKALVRDFSDDPDMETRVREVTMLAVLLEEERRETGVFDQAALDAFTSPPKEAK
mgnify:CR=1 FL=1